MGTSYSQKSFLSKKAIILLVGLALTGIVMLFLSPAHKLDSRFYYSYEQAVSYLQNLNELQKQNYLVAEFFDFWFMANYTWILFLAVHKYLPAQLLWTAFLPGILDLLETLLIVSFLFERKFSWAHQLLPYFSSLKWLLAFSLLLYLIKMIFWRRAYR